MTGSRHTHTKDDQVRNDRAQDPEMKDMVTEMESGSLPTTRGRIKEKEKPMCPPRDPPLTQDPNHLCREGGWGEGEGNERGGDSPELSPCLPAERRTQTSLLTSLTLMGAGALQPNYSPPLTVLFLPV